MIDQLIVKQKKEMLEAITAVMGAGFETSNKYKIKNVLGQVCNASSVLYIEQLSLPSILEHLQSEGGHGLLHEKYLWPGEAVRYGHSGQRGEGGSPPQQASPLRLLLFPLLSAGAGGQRPARRCHRICQADLVLHEAPVRLGPS